MWALLDSIVVVKNLIVLFESNDCLFHTFENFFFSFLFLENSLLVDL